MRKERRSLDGLVENCPCGNKGQRSGFGMRFYVHVDWHRIDPFQLHIAFNFQVSEVISFGPKKCDLTSKAAAFPLRYEG